ncbi:hypothetical protein KIW84_013388 [Lathyrus oleraceus]|uniref:TOG domain-containing protein n=1 Tax=Pisum sativum TaxID=3888 RepID=A0A9D5GXY2_PEA|nr:hypothetical protein KIW84_013388 [Pisum sativum]
MNCVVLVEFQQLLQLLLKASQDKEFVCEEAERALGSMVGSMTPLPLLQKLRVSVSHKNLRIRAKTAVSLSKCVSKMVNEEMEEFGMEKLIEVVLLLLAWLSLFNSKLDGLNELNRGPRAKGGKNQKVFAPTVLAVKGQNLPTVADEEKEKTPNIPDREQYNKADFPEEYTRGPAETWSGLFVDVRGCERIACSSAAGCSISPCCRICVMLDQSCHVCLDIHGFMQFDYGLQRLVLVMQSCHVWVL